MATAAAARAEEGFGTATGGRRWRLRSAALSEGRRHRLYWHGGRAWRRTRHPFEHRSQPVDCRRRARRPTGLARSEPIPAMRCCSCSAPHRRCFFRWLLWSACAWCAGWIPGRMRRALLVAAIGVVLIGIALGLYAGSAVSGPSRRLWRSAGLGRRLWRGCGGALVGNPADRGAAAPVADGDLGAWPASSSAGSRWAFGPRKSNGRPTSCGAILPRRGRGRGARAKSWHRGRWRGDSAPLPPGGGGGRSGAGRLRRPPRPNPKKGKGALAGSGQPCPGRQLPAPVARSARRAAREGQEARSTAPGSNATPGCWRACSRTSMSAATSSRFAQDRSSPCTNWSQPAASRPAGLFSWPTTLRATCRPCRRASRPSRAAA